MSHESLGSFSFGRWDRLGSAVHPGPQAVLLPVDRYGTCGKQKEAASNLPTVGAFSRAAFDATVIVSTESVVLDCALTTHALGPPAEIPMVARMTKGLGHRTAKPSGQK